MIDGAPDRICIVDDVRPPRCIVLRQPVSVELDPPVGSTLVLSWKTSEGLHQLTAVLASQLWDHMPLWELEVLHDPMVSQQRAYTRASDALPVELTQAEHRWRAIVVDLSEGGARCVLRPGEAPVVGGTVELHLSLDGRQLALAAEVLSVELGTDDRQVARLRFAALGRTADVLHRRVIEQQRRARAVGRT